MGTIRESIESAFVAVAFAERNRPDEAVWQLRGGDDAARPGKPATRRRASPPQLPQLVPSPAPQPPGNASARC